ncbi:myo-inositol 2-dehydrogenase [Octadecabacter temperatus]|uniref:Inositol 2-dehydrogenase n=1 Tax=Octadecabacter temperatus TaxID=1458307 RepID=A0A0K0Y8C9_9RHOB|nr:inositol 2-dehydrogenase [Octadecabacter temperatus]AKS47175.1 Inositol 2-dehydrogenase [Octadecabacter temperatus]SIO45680.1 myo-inositol 2-dehydrogenase [Octadecabacter temperatus]
MLNVGLLGCGRIGQVHGATLSGMKTARTVAVSDFLPEAANALASQLNAKVMTSDQMLEDPGIDAVVIGTPTTTHYDLIHKAAAHGKAIFCEKPVDLSVDRIRECLSAVEVAGVPFMVAFNRRFDPSFAHLQKQISDQVIGDVELVTILSRDPAPPPIGYIKTSGGIFRDMMIHDLDMARFLLGEEPVELTAEASCLVDPAIGEAGDFDTAVVTLKTANGKICQISNSRRATYGYDQRIEVHGSKGMLRADNMLENSVQLATGAGHQTAATQPFFLERYAAAYRAEMEHFVSCIAAGVPIAPTGEDGLKAQILADAADAAARDGLRRSLSQT